MWSRVVEAMLGCWLLTSPFVFRHPGDDPALWVFDLTCGSLVIVFGLFSFWQPTRHAHLITLVVASVMIAFAYWRGFGDPSPASQNHLVTGLLLLMFGIIPNDADHPPATWVETKLHSRSKPMS